MEEENRIISLLSKHWSKLLLGLLAVACIAVWGERRSRSGEQQSRQDFFTAHQLFTKLQKGETLPLETLETAEIILKKHPELHPKFDAPLALALFSQAKSEEGGKYAELLLNRVSSELPPLYKQFSQGTLLIAEAHYAEAYQGALSLQEQLKGQTGYQQLDAMNTLRLLFLAERLGNALQKQLHWEALTHHPRYKDIQALFHEGTLSLENYIHP